MIIQYTGRKITFLASHFPEILILLLGRSRVEDLLKIKVIFLLPFHFDERLRSTMNIEEKSLRHVAVVVTFLDDTTGTENSLKR